MNKKETMHDCYLSQFNCLSTIMDNRNILLHGFKSFYTKYNPERLLLVGSGTSFHACSAAASFMEKILGLEVTVAAPTLLPNIYGKTIAIAVSQGGRSTNTIQAVEHLKASQVPVVTLTDYDEADTPVGRAGDLSLRLAADDEQIGPKTRGYAATVFTLYLMALEITKGDDTDLRHIVSNGPLYLKTCAAFFDCHVETIKKARYYMFVGKGASAKASNESALKIVETVCCPASGYEFEEFLHGPAFCADENMALFLIFPQDEDKKRMQKAAELFSRITDNIYIISHDPLAQGEKILYLPCAEAVSPVVDVLIAQLISAKLPNILGRGRHPAVQDIAKEMATKVL